MLLCRLRRLYAVRHAWYELPEFPWPAELRRSSGEGAYPSGGSIQAYLRAYAARFDLLAAAQTRTRVTSVEHEPDGWRVTVLPTAGANQGNATTVRFTHVVIATGAYGTPFVPPVDGGAAFKGEQLPAAQFTSAARAAGKDVVVVGAGKSALDVAAAAVQTARSVTLLARKVHWPLAPFLGGIIPYEFAAYARLAKFGRAYYTAAPLQRAIHALFAPVKWLIWRVVEVLLRLQFRLSGPLSPDEPIERDVYYTGQIYPRDDFFKAVRARKIKVLKGACRCRPLARAPPARAPAAPPPADELHAQVRRCNRSLLTAWSPRPARRCRRSWWFGPRGTARTTSGACPHPCPAWRPLLPPLLLSCMAPPPSAVRVQGGRVDACAAGPAGRRAVPLPQHSAAASAQPAVRGRRGDDVQQPAHARAAGGVGRRAGCGACGGGSLCLWPAMFGVRCCRPRTAEAPRVRVAQGELALPAAEVQMRDVERLRAWRRSFIPANNARAAKYQLHGNQYHDQLVRDLGHSTLRKARRRSASDVRGCPCLTLLARQPWWTLGLAELLWPTQASDYRALVTPSAANAR